MRTYLVPFLLLLVSGAVDVEDTGCPISGLATESVGVGTGGQGPSTLVMTIDPSSCVVLVTIDAVQCCNTILVRHFLGLADSLLETPLPLGDRFLPGSMLWIWPQFVVGPLPGSTSEHAVPPDPALVGRHFAAQAVPVFFTTVNGGLDLGTTQGVRAQFL